VRKNGRILNKKILNALLAGAMLSSCNYNTAWANSGGTLVELKDCYIGNSSSGSDVVIDENNSSTSIYGGTMLLVQDIPAHPSQLLWGWL
jgi:hypothetical protein